MHGTHELNLADRRGAVVEGETTFLQEAREPLVSNANLSGDGFQGPAASVGGFRSLEELFGCSRCGLWVVPRRRGPWRRARIDWCGVKSWQVV